MKLVIVESPTKTKSLNKYLGNGYEVMASMGHLVDLPKSKFGVEIEKKGKKYHFDPDYIQVKGKGKQVKSLKSAAKKADEVILATDPDREGEAIAYHVRELLKKESKNFSRIVFHSITKDAVLEAMEHKGEVDISLVDAQQARRVLDRVVGYKLSPVLWKKVRRGLSAGRVQSVALRMIVEREREIEAFKPVEYWVIEVEVEAGKEKFWVMLRKIEGKKAEVGKEKEAKEIEADLNKAKYKVLDVVQKERRAYPRPPFKTSTMQQAAANVLGWSSKKTMSVAQNLYEHGKITYHRTDSINLANSSVEIVRKFIVSEWGEKYVSTKPRFYKAGKQAVVAQEAHEAIRPTDISVGTNAFVGTGKMANDQKKLYDLIWRRTVSSQMAEAVFDATKVVVEGKGKKTYELVANGEVIKFDGWRKLYKKDKDFVQLPKLEKGADLKKKEVKAEQKFTLPPARYNDASLVKELEARGIGRPSTYASIISTIVLRNYVERKDRRFFATSIGTTVSDFLVKNFENAMDYGFTAKMEDGLDEIAAGKEDWQKYLSDFYGPFITKVEDVEKNAKRVEMPVIKLNKKCPDCKEGELIIREGRFGKFISCDRFPECKYTDKYVVYLEGQTCPDCGGKVVIKKTRRGREFYGCENYPKCKWASWKKPGEEEEKKDEEKNPSKED